MNSHLVARGSHELDTRNLKAHSFYVEREWRHLFMQRFEPCKAAKPKLQGVQKLVLLFGQPISQPNVTVEGNNSNHLFSGVCQFFWGMSWPWTCRTTLLLGWNQFWQDWPPIFDIGHNVTLVKMTAVVIVKVFMPLNCCLPRQTTNLHNTGPLF